MPRLNPRKARMVALSAFWDSEVRAKHAPTSVDSATYLGQEARFQQRSISLFAIAVSFDQPCVSGPRRNLSARWGLLVWFVGWRPLPTVGGSSHPSQNKTRKNRGNTGTTKTIKSETNAAVDMCDGMLLCRVVFFVANNG